METLEIIRKLCEEKGISVSRLEKNLGYGNTSISRAKNISSHRVVEIANYFGVSVDYLLGRTDDPDFRLPRKTVYVGSPAYEDKILEEIDNVIEKRNANSSEPAPSSYNAEQIAKALELYEKYQKAIPQVQAAVETLLKDSQSDS